MARHPNLERRKPSGVYYARLDIPVDLIAHYNRPTLKKSLFTKDPMKAKRLYPPVIEGWRCEFDGVRSRRSLTADDKARAVWDHFTRTVELDAQRRLAMPTQSDIDAEEQKVWEKIETGQIQSNDMIGMINAQTEHSLLSLQRTLDANGRARRLAALRRDLASGTTDLVAGETEVFITKNRLLVGRNSSEFNELCQLLLRGEIEGLRRTLERDLGDYSGVPRDPIVKPSTGVSKLAAPVGETLSELFEQYARENQRKISLATLKQQRRDVGTLIQLVGTSFHVSGLDKSAVRQWKALLLRYPVKATESAVFAGMTMKQIIVANEQVKKPIISGKTVNRYLASLGAFCRWLVDHSYITVSPTSGMFLAKDDTKTTLPFSTEQLNLLFRSPLFTGCQSDAQWRFIKKPGNVRIRDHRYWIPLIMLFSGARPGEVAQLQLADVREQHGGWIMHITVEGTGEKRVKTKGSMRILPVHSELLRLGFAQYHSEMIAEGHTAFFPGAKRNDNGQMVPEFSDGFNKYLTHLKIKSGKGISLYSFRHGTVDAFRRDELLDEQFGFMLGHAKATMTGRYGNMPEGMLRQRVELVESIKYPGLDLRHLYG
ncbi:DUF6538 domain-containing protein [Rhizobium sp. LjRoot254]|uniref:DUF6538 domain-containing protein n=1 Tax=Rhizobium sp. LjRoot254 TaxID=3342297 RepID=UPI003ECF6EFC